MDIYFYTKHERMGASSRYRTLQYIENLKDNHFNFICRPLFTDKYLTEKYKSGKTPFLLTVSCYFRRLFNLIMDCRAGRIFLIEKELFPYVPYLFEFFISVLNIRFIVDYDDAVWHNYDNSKYFIIRFFLGRKHKKIISSAYGVICGNKYLESYAVLSGQKNTIIIPTVVPKVRYVSIKKPTNNFTIVWIGSPSTSRYLLSIKNQLKEFIYLTGSTLKIIGFDKFLTDSIDFPASFVEWSNETEIKELSDSDVGIMPLTDGPFERGKCGFKLIQYMGVGKASIASDIGANSDIVLDGETGYLVKNDSDWLIYLMRLFNDRKLCSSMGLKARQRFENFYTLESQTKRYIEFISS